MGVERLLAAASVGLFFAGGQVACGGPRIEPPGDARAPIRGDAGTDSPETVLPSLDGAVDAPSSTEGGPSTDAGTSVDTGPGRTLAQPIVLAGGQENPAALVVDATNVYWLDLGAYVPDGPVGGGKMGGGFPNGALMACSLVGCDGVPIQLASGWAQPGGTNTIPAALALGSSTLYWVGSGQVLSRTASTANYAWTALTPNVGASGIATDGAHVYFTAADDGQVADCPLGGAGDAGCVPAELAQAQVGPQGILVDATNVYWVTASGTLATCPIGGCPNGFTVIWSGQRGSTQAATLGLATDGDTLYWTNANGGGAGSVMQCAKADCAGTLRILADGRSAPRGIAADGVHVYWTEFGDYDYDAQAFAGQVLRCPKGGGDITVIASNQNAPAAIALDETTVYWANQGTANSDGQVLALPK
jgi:hypothetical protein